MGSLFAVGAVCVVSFADQMPKTFEDLVFFKRARVLIRSVYAVTHSFPRQELYGLVQQMRRAAVSVLSNCAEAQGRVTFGERRQLLSQARGSLFEVDAQCIAAADLGFMTAATLKKLRSRVRAVGRPLSGYIRWVQNCEKKRQ
jgi:four helix bundle protein